MAATPEALCFGSLSVQLNLSSGKHSLSPNIYCGIGFCGNHVLCPQTCPGEGKHRTNVQGRGRCTEQAMGRSQHF